MTMKKQAGTLLILMLAGLAGLVNAQTSVRIKAQVPFGFVANGKTMPAGECIISNVVAASGLLTIRSGKQSVFALPMAVESPNVSNKTALVFHRYGGRYFLAGIKYQGEISYQLPASRLEGELRARNVTEEVYALLASAN